MIYNPLPQNPGKLLRTSQYTISDMNAVEDIRDLIRACREENDMDSKLLLFELIRKMLVDSTGKDMRIPSLLTDDFINSALDRIRH